jgi:hypothetical protein
MKYSIISIIMAAFISVAGCGKKSDSAHNPIPPTETNSSIKITYSLPGSHSNTVERLHKRVALSQVVAYANANTNDAPNIVLTVVVIWKGADEASALGITNGTQIPLRMTGDEASATLIGRFPDGAILFFQRPISPSEAPFQYSEMLYVWAGRISLDRLTIQDFRTKFGL